MSLSRWAFYSFVFITDSLYLTPFSFALLYLKGYSCASDISSTSGGYGDSGGDSDSGSGGCGYGGGGDGGCGCKITFAFGVSADGRFTYSRVINIPLPASSSELSTKTVFVLWDFVWFATCPCNYL